MKVGLYHLNSKHVPPKELKENIRADTQGVHKLKNCRVRDVGKSKAFRPYANRRPHALLQFIQQSRLASPSPAQHYTAVIRTVRKEIQFSGVNKACFEKCVV